MPVDSHPAVVWAGEWGGDFGVEDAGPGEDLRCAILRADGERAVREQHGGSVGAALVGVGVGQHSACVCGAGHDGVVEVCREGDAALGPCCCGVVATHLPQKHQMQIRTTIHFCHCSQERNLR